MNVATLYFSVWLIADLGASNTRICRRRTASRPSSSCCRPVARRRVRCAPATQAMGRRIHARLVRRLRRDRRPRPATAPDQRSETIGGDDAAGRMASDDRHLWLGDRRVRRRELRVSGGAAVLQRDAARSRAARRAGAAVRDRHGGRICRHDRRRCSSSRRSSTERFRCSARCRRARPVTAARARAVHVARRPCVDVRADGDAVSAFLAAALLLLPRS